MKATDKKNDYKLPPLCFVCDTEDPYHLVVMQSEQVFRGQTLLVQHHAWACGNCGEHILSGKELDELRASTLRQYQVSNGLLTGDQIKEKRMRLNLSQRELAKKIGISKPSLARWETSKTIQNLGNDRLLRQFFDAELVDTVTMTKTFGLTIELNEQYATKPIWLDNPVDLSLCA